MAHVKLSRITKTFGAHTALRDLDLEIRDGEFFVLLGPTGAGKTTTLRLIAGLDKPTSGRVEIGGVDVGEWGAAERDVALVLQQYSLYPRYTVRQNLEFPLKSNVRRLPQSEINDRVARAAKTLRIEHLLDRKVDRLSGGEMQRVSIGRAIVRSPRIFLMDEPLSNLDAKLREALRSELKDLQMKLGATFLFVTHDQIEAMSMGDQVGVLNGGKLVQVGTPYEIYHHPRDIFVAGFVGSPAMNLVDAEIDDRRIRIPSARLDLPLDARGDGRLGHVRGPVTLGMRAEDIHVDPSGPIEARIYGVENHGVEKIVTLKTGELIFKATTSAATPTEIDAPLRLAWDQGRMHAFDRATGTSVSERAARLPELA
ncbi:ABC transporter ATP-binding protein [Kaistia dalseonensis]|uniref:Multiple sugar transport system ATP-binding protein n=1 Tax=Kaistia dalseonensis TaxID=410840 RepID=A0ABU0H8H6_9HYPH|nr:ABC transporter ATP-binding protein [Kaistia dalseonensis]MCX5496016.1 ABC transporter ATP-binding protein [Kaistia dalseonensis]MDQ0438619.1 multiple sugar transport system ATP-binding protein [Kaistia dalseonensis]